jgi:hypothetical protein
LENVNVKSNFEDINSNFENRSYGRQFNYFNDLGDVESDIVFEIFKCASGNNLSGNVYYRNSCYKVLRQSIEAMKEYLLGNHFNQTLVDSF